MIRKIREAREEEGFTLIELLVVVIIIGILAAIAIPVFLNQRQKAFRSAVKADLHNAATNLESYYTDANTYVGFTQVMLDGLESDGVVLTFAGTAAANPGPSGYCVEGTHAGITSAPTTFRVNTNGATSAKPEAGNCP